MSIILWPRQEVLQLVIPELAVVGRVLNASTAMSVIRRLTRYQSPEGKLSFDRWLVVAKDVLRWNDNSIQLFWDMASLSTYYMHKEASYSLGRTEGSLDLQYLAIFIILHLNEESKSLSPTQLSSVVYEDTWPTNNSSEEERDLMAGVGSMGSPKRDSASSRSRSRQMPTSPGSPKAGHALSLVDSSTSALPPGVNAHSFKSSAQYLHSVKQKIPLILRALCIEQQEGLDDTMTDLAMYADGGGGLYHHLPPFVRTEEFFVNKRAVDALGLIICGGLSRDQSVPYLSSLFPVFQSADNDVAMRSSGDLDDLMSLGAGSHPSISYSELSSSISAHISMNDTFYPVSTVPLSSSGDGSSCSNDPNDQLDERVALPRSAVDADYSPPGGGKVQQPFRLINSLSLLTRSVPTVLNWSSTTIMHIVSSSGGLSRPSSFRRSNSRSSRSLGSIEGDSPMKSGESSSPIAPCGGGIGDFIDNTSPGKTLARTLSKTFSFKVDTNLSSGPVEDLIAASSCSPRSASNMDYGTDIEAESFGMMIRKVGWSPIDFMLPPLYLNFCTEARLYLISPYHSASIRNCADCDIVIGSVHGAVIVSHCESVRITVACRKLLIMDCTNCAFNIATLSTTVVSGDTKNVLIGPYNSAYKNLRNHLIMAGLEALCCPVDNEGASDLTINNINDADGMDSSTSSPPPPPTLCVDPSDRDGIMDDGIDDMFEPMRSSSSSPDVLSNCWSSLCDVSSCLDGLPLYGSPSGYAMDAMDAAADSLPPPMPDIARLQPFDDFQLISIPYKNEFDSFDHCPIAVPRDYKESLEQRKQVTEQIKSQLASIFESSQQHVDPTEEELKKQQVAANAAISKKFMEWLVRSGNAKQVLDLVRIDGEKFGLSFQGSTGSQPVARASSSS